MNVMKKENYLSRLRDNKSVEHIDMMDIDPVYKLREQTLFKVLKNKKGKLLDVGCNNGTTSLLLAKKGFEVYGIDNDRALIKKLKKNKAIKVVFGDCEKKFPYKDNFFDIVWVGDIIEHLNDTEFFVSELSRVTKPWGMVIVATPYHGFWKNLSIASFSWNRHYHPSTHHLRFYSIKTLSGQLNRHNLRTKRVYFLGRIKPLAKSMFLVSRKEKEC